MRAKRLVSSCFTPHVRATATRNHTQRFANEAKRLLRFHFSFDMFEGVKKVGDDYQWRLMTSELINFAHIRASNILSGEIFYRPVSDIDGFINAITPVFSPSVVMQIRYNLDSFDTIAGFECTEVFLGQQTICDWVFHIIAEYLKPLRAFDQVSAPREGHLVSFTSSNLLTWPPQTVPQLGGPSDMFNFPTDRTVQQVVIRGRTVLEAWTTNATTRQLSMMKKDKQRLRHDPENLDSIWTPRQAGGNPVYHGSIIRNKKWPQRFNETPFSALQPRINSNQMVTDAFPVIFTAFSPLRCFLWAAFDSMLPYLTPSAQDILHTQDTWVNGGRTYKGVVLFKFHSTQPAPAVLTHYVIPEGKEGQWGSRSLSDNNKGISHQNVWGHYRDIHGQSGDAFPDLVHGLEYGNQLNGLSPFRTNMWRTIWRATAASDHLNAQHAATYAISFELGSSTAPPLPSTR
ncbi:hypothetical protein LY78DRAFT_711766 [Colletotrichum sublineola]|nr:hypothetical protein LY78DRAFT_711766 [Colletotrichum sublineola]